MEKEKKYLKKLYNKGMEILREHTEEICFRVMKSRDENKGNFAYLEDDDIKREQKLAHYLQLFLYRTNLQLENREHQKGECGKICIECTYPRYKFHSKRAPTHWNNQDKEGWYCKVECECK